MSSDYDTGALIGGASLVALAVFHSWLGERRLIGPLLANPELPAFAIGNAFAKHTLRLAWHLTSLAWLALSYLLLRDKAAALPIAVLLAVSGVVTHAATRGRHFAWAVFMLGAIGAVSASGIGTWHSLLGAVAGTVLAVIGSIHVGWAFGIHWGLDAALPEEAGRRVLTPSAATTLAIAACLFLAAWLTFALAGLAPSPVSERLLWSAGLVAAFVFGGRTIGDLHYVGLFKRVRGSHFARQDDALFTPLCFALCAAIVLQL
jgi:hypothetical protein